MPIPLIPDITVFQRKLSGFPLETYQAGESVLIAGSTTGRLLILKAGAVEVVREGVQIAKVTEPGAVFGELSVLLHRGPACATQDRPDWAPLRCNSPGTASRQRQSGPHRAEAPGSSWRAAWCDRQDGREDGTTAGRQWRQSRSYRLSP